MRQRISISIILGILFTVGLAACGPQPPEKVEVKLTEFGIESSRTDFKVGQTYEITVTNAGTVGHEFMIMPPLDNGGMHMDMGAIDQQALAMIPIDQLPAGATQTVTVTFKQPVSPGNLEFACHTPGHYEQNMRMPITVQP
jgi:uncharacterized cupredoxin-like copper-binding protein